MMNTTIRKGKSPFYGDAYFPQGLNRSGYFNKRQSEELISYGYTLMCLCDGTLMPENEEEKLFVQEIHSAAEPTLYAVKLWNKYKTCVSKTKVHHSFTKSHVSEAKDDNSAEFN